MSLRIHHEDTKARRFDERTEAQATEVVDAIFQVHAQLAPGLLESVYAVCLREELRSRGIGCECELELPIFYKQVKIDSGLRIDLLVANQILIEIKAVETLPSVHKAQLISYLKLSGKSLGFLVNFNVSTIREGIKRIVL